MGKIAKIHVLLAATLALGASRAAAEAASLVAPNLKTHELDRLFEVVGDEEVAGADDEAADEAVAQLDSSSETPTVASHNEDKRHENASNLLWVLFGATTALSTLIIASRLGGRASRVFLYREQAQLRQSIDSAWSELRAAKLEPSEHLESPQPGEGSPIRLISSVRELF